MIGYIICFHWVLPKFIPQMPFKLEYRPVEKSFVYDERRLVEEQIDLTSTLQWYYISSTAEVVFFYWAGHIEEEKGLNSFPSIPLGLN
jgi:hypothetical protein